MLHVNVGTNLYGRVLNVPGVLYVATVFRHVAFIPLAPVTSWIVLEEPGLRKFFRRSSRWQGLQLAVPVWRSVFAAWFRAALVLFALWHLIAEGYHGMTRFEPVAWPWVWGAVAAIAVASVAGRLGRARLEPVAELLRMADAPDSLANRVELAFGQKIQGRWPGRDSRAAPTPGEAAQAWSPEDEAAWGDDGDAAAEDSELALTFSQRHAARIGGAVALLVGLGLAFWERSRAHELHRYSPKQLTIGFMLISGGLCAVVLGIGRDRDLKVPWKMGVLAAAAIAGLLAGTSAPAWFF